MAGMGGGLSDLKGKLSGLLSLGGGQSCLGISIGTSSIKAVELKPKGKGWQLFRWGQMPLPEEAIVNREISNHVAVLETLKSLIGTLQVKSKNAALGLSGGSLILKRMQVQVKNQREIQESVFWEAEQYLSFDISQVVLDFHVLNRAKDGSTDVLLAALKTSVLDGYTQVVEEAGLNPKVVDADFFALQNVAELNYAPAPGEAMAIVDVGAAATKMIVVQGGNYFFHKDTALGGRALTQEIQRALKVSFADAEVFKVGGGGGVVPQQVADQIQKVAEGIGSDIKRTLDMYNANSVGPPVGLILLSGGGARIQGLTRIVEEMAGRHTEILNPFLQISADPALFSPELLTLIAPVAAVPVGLALRMGAK